LAISVTLGPASLILPIQAFREKSFHFATEKKSRHRGKFILWLHLYRNLWRVCLASTGVA